LQRRVAAQDDRVDFLRHHQLLSWSQFTDNFSLFKTFLKEH
jgi:hypothetical protein